MLQGYSFAKLGARYPSAGGLLEYVRQGFGDGHFTGIIAWLLLATNAIITAMVAVSFGSYASEAVADGSTTLGQVFAVLVVVVMSLPQHRRIAGRRPGADGHRLRRARHPHALRGHDARRSRSRPPRVLRTTRRSRDIVSSVALTFFAFLGFGVITFTAKDLAEPSRQLPRAMYLALGHRDRRSTSPSRSACSAR